MKHAVIFKELIWENISSTLEGLEIIRQIPPLKSFTVLCSMEKAEAIRADQNVNSVVEVSALYLDAVASYPIPDNPRWPSQWELAMIDLPAANIVSNGGESVVVAVIDSGYVPGHDAFIGKSVSGYSISDVPSWDSATDYHGTQVAAMIASVATPNSGMGSVANNADIMPIRVTTDSVSSASDDEIAEAISMALAYGADIINISMSGDVLPILTAMAINEAISSGVVVVSSAGNTNTDSARYPAALPGVVSVGALDRNRNKAMASSFGATVDILAPGQEVTVPSSDGGYTQISGTSYSAPMVSGVAALVKGANRTLTAEQISSILTDTSLPYPDLYSKFPSAGLVNAKLAVLAAMGEAGSVQRIVTFIDRDDVLTSEFHNINIQPNATARIDVFGAAVDEVVVKQYNQFVYFGPSSHKTENILCDNGAAVRVAN